MSDGASNASGACDAPQYSPSRRASQTLLIVHINTQTLRQHKAHSGQVRQPLSYVLALPVPRMDTCSSSARDASENGATVAMVFLPRNYYKGTMIPSTFRAKPSHDNGVWKSALAAAVRQSQCGSILQDGCMGGVTMMIRCAAWAKK